MSFPCGSAGKESTCNEGDLGSIPGLGRSPGEGKGYSTPVFWPGEFLNDFSSGLNPLISPVLTFKCYLKILLKYM